MATLYNTAMLYPAEKPVKKVLLGLLGSKVVAIAGEKMI